MSGLEGNEVSTKPSAMESIPTKPPVVEAKRVVQNEQEKMRKEKIKKCISEIATELPPSTEHLDRKPVSILLHIILSIKKTDFKIQYYYPY